MKHCGYCGKNNPDNVVSCAECGTPLASDSSDASGGIRDSNSPLALGITSGVGVLLISTALLFCIGRVLCELGIIPGRVVAAQDTATYSFFTSKLPAPFIALAAIPGIFAICRARSLERQLANLTAVVSSFILLLLAFLPWIVPAAVALWCLPAVVFWRQSGSSAACYVGAAVQFGAGALLLFWFRPQRSKNEPTAA